MAEYSDWRAKCLRYFCAALRQPCNAQTITAEEGGCLWSNGSPLLTACLTTIVRKCQVNAWWAQDRKGGLLLRVCVWRQGEISITGGWRASLHLAGAWSGPLWFPLVFLPSSLRVLLHKQKGWNESRAVLTSAERAETFHHYLGDRTREAAIFSAAFKALLGSL